MEVQKKLVVVYAGKILNFGPWPTYHYEIDGEPVEGRIPYPEGTIEGEFDLAVTERGELVLAGDYQSLRRDAYPAITDQLDALWKGGSAAAGMRDEVLAVKQRYPKGVT